MQAIRLTTLTALIAAAGFSSGGLFAQSMNPSIPVGKITAFPLIVQPGTRPQLTWKIAYPSIVQDVTDIEGVGTVVATEELDVEVRVLGAGVTAGSTNSSSYQFVPTEAQLSYDGGSYTRIFYGTNNNVKPNQVVYRGTVLRGKKLRFGGRYYYNRKWGPYFNSQSSTPNVRTLVNGEVPPTSYPLYNAPTLQSFLRPYLDSEGRLKIGPMDLIVLMELTHTDAQKRDPGYDLQDMVLLVTFRSKNNNGHGNNLDGVDSSNPGNAPFTDTNSAVDDER
ncbi:MAG: hypothetical protein EAZ84_11590 [Verrucomicrobia bacterium]|nr:MAG: hypothetical protein EAZ84_11590 [Verrucomicrobiota bacterium]TAE88718.1 MAG: hypothetical protein EAZ82_03185 [Verrucomicrobiota bacterium]TAF26520.1 MAG: hypothetical protein EAZ71_04710 [Verrucomicrobiota bacterium]